MPRFPLDQRVRFSMLGTDEDWRPMEAHERAALAERVAAIPGVKRVRGAWEWQGTFDAIAAARRLGGVRVEFTPPVTAGGTVPFAPDLNGGMWDWLMPFQRDVVLRTVDMGGGHVHSAPGSGKTVMGIVWALATASQWPVVIVTRAGSRPTWEREIKRFTSITPWIGKPAHAFKKNDREIGVYTEWCHETRQRPVFVLGYESLVEWVEPIRWILARWEYLCRDMGAGAYGVSIIFDELHRAKQHKRRKSILTEEGKNRLEDLGNTSSACEKLSRMGQRRLGTTATPLANRTRDLWAQLDLVQPGAHGTFWAWAIRHCAAAQGEWGWNTDGSSNEEELKARLGVVAVNVPYSVSHGQLPPLRREVVFLKPEDQNVEAGGFAREMKQAAREDRGNDGSRMKEIRLTLAASRKRTYVVREIVEAVAGGQKVLVFTNRRKLREALTEAVVKAVPEGTPVWGVDGDDSVEAREEARSAYMDYRPTPTGGCVFIATGDSMGEGVDFQDTDLFLVAMLPWTPGQLWQWLNRVSRLGQKRPCLARFIVAEGTYDERVAGILLDKLPAVDEIIGDEALAGLATQIEGVEGHRDELLDSLVAKILARPKLAEWEPALPDGEEA